ERALVQLGSPSAEHRGQLERFVVCGIEAELARLGAAPPGWRYDDGLESITSDQLYRARLLGHSGLAARFDALRGLADAGGQLGAEDSSTLRRLVTLAEREPLQLYLPRGCAELQIIGGPEPLSAWLPPRIEPGRVASIEYDDPANASEAPALADTDVPAAPLLPPPVEAFLGGAETPLPPKVRELVQTPRPPIVGAIAEAPLPPKVRATVAEQSPSPARAAEPRERVAAAAPEPSAEARPP